ncbi:alanine racemase [Sulfurimonas sp.]|jgi:alanine racemase|uniref:alanine racemase n=1 Tax=Sulfurimonas sp. TaxID=2022749 RepID=UPI0025FF97FA|nr:alanine racemase [Sulfurimonas sp.]MCK9472935.1 alanine racemase [Sulfurimonas sp.]MDD3505013.1 alanine racemase [Sulfurimonas sp.]
MATIILNKNNFFNNLDIISKSTKTRDKIALVLKDNAYGHGLLEVASMAKEYGISKAVVCSCKEAKLVDDFFEYILVLGEIPTSKSDKIRYTINDIKSIDKFPIGTKVELKVDTGMHRNGISMSELEEAFIKTKEAGLLLEAVFTHHSSADELTSEWFWQKENFKKVKEKSRMLAHELGLGALRFHSSNSASLFRLTNFDEDMTRVGIAAYGCLELPKALQVDGLKPVLSLWATRLSSRAVKAGERVGYGGDYVAHRDCVISNYNFGYGDGFLRACANGYVTPEGVELLGRISMDNSTFATSKEKLLVFNDARVVAKYAKTIGYEVLTALKEKIKREIV